MLPLLTTIPSHSFHILKKDKVWCICHLISLFSFSPKLWAWKRKSFLSGKKFLSGHTKAEKRKKVIFMNDVMTCFISGGYYLKWEERGRRRIQGMLRTRIQNRQATASWWCFRTIFNVSYHIDTLLINWLNITRVNIN